MKTIKITQIINLPMLDNYFSSSMVDIAYIDKVKGDTVTLLIEDDININNEEDEKWLLDLLHQALQKCEEYSAKIIIE
jgi:hypothetical protein